MKFLMEVTAAIVVVAFVIAVVVFWPYKESKSPPVHSSLTRQRRIELRGSLLPQAGSTGL